MNGTLQRAKRIFGSGVRASLFAAGLLALPAASQAGWGYKYDGDLAAVKADIATEITDIQFHAGDDPRFEVYFTVDATDLGDFKVGGKFRIQVNKARIGPGRFANAAGVFRFAPRKFEDAGPYKATFRLNGRDWGGVLPEAKYKAALKVALHKGGTYYRDLNMDDNKSQMSTRYYTDLVAKDVTVEGQRMDETVKMALHVTNAGNRPTGTMKMKWWTKGVREVVEVDSWDPEAEEDLEFTFERPDDQPCFGRKVKFLIRDSQGILRLRKVRKIKKGSSTIVVEIDPDETEPEEEERFEGVDYHVSDVNASPFCLGDGLWVFHSTVTNEGQTDGDEYSKVKWEKIRWGYDGNINSGQGVGLCFEPITNCVKPLEVNESEALLAKVRLLVADDINPENYNVSGKLLVTPVEGEEQVEDNEVEFDLRLCSPQEEEPTPPEIDVSEISATLHYPKYAGYDGSLTLAVSLQNDGGEAETVDWSIRVEGLDVDDDEVFAYSTEDVGSGSGLEEEFVTFKMPEDKWAADDSDEKRVYTAVVSGTSTYGRNGDLQGPEFESTFQFEVGKYPRPDVDVTIFVKDSAGNEYVPRDQLFNEEESTLEADLQIENNGKVPVHEDDPITVEYGIDNFLDTETVTIAGLGREVFEHKLEVDVDCEYWNSDRNELWLNASQAPAETNTENNEAYMGLKFNGSGGPDC